MPTLITCPECTTSLRPKKAIPAGTQITCPKCKTIFRAAETVMNSGESSVADRPSRLRSDKVEDRGRRQRTRDEFDDLDEPLRRRRSRDRDDYDNRPRRRSDADYDDYEDDDRASRGRRKHPGGSKMPLWIGLGVGGGVLVVGLVVLLVFVFSGSGGDNVNGENGNGKRRKRLDALTLPTELTKYLSKSSHTLAYANVGEQLRITSDKSKLLLPHKKNQDWLRGLLGTTENLQWYVNAWGPNNVKVFRFSEPFDQQPIIQKCRTVHAVGKTYYRRKQRYHRTFYYYYFPDDTTVIVTASGAIMNNVIREYPGGIHSKLEEMLKDTKGHFVEVAFSSSPTAFHTQRMESITVEADKIRIQTEVHFRSEQAARRAKSAVQRNVRRLESQGGTLKLELIASKIVVEGEGSFRMLLRR